MMKKTHIVVGVALSSIVAVKSGIQLTPIYLVTSAIGAIMPDADHPHGAINQKLLLVHNKWFKSLFYAAIALIVLFYGTKSMDYKLVLYIVPVFLALGFSRHRSVTHSFLGLIGAMILMKFIKTSYGVDLVIPFTIGYASHILIDMLNPQGVELLWPYDKNFKVPFISIDTGGIIEKISLYVFLIAFIYVFVGHNNVEGSFIASLVDKLF